MERMSTRISIFVLELSIVLLNFFFIYFFLREFKLFYHLNVIPSHEIVKGVDSLTEYLHVFWGALSIWTAILWLRGGSQDLSLQSYSKSIRHLTINTVLFLFCFTSFSFLFKFTYLSRMFIFIYAFSSFLWLLVNRLVLLHLAKQARKKGHNLRHILLAGTGRRAQEFISHIAKHSEWGYRLIGLLDRDPWLKGERIAGYPVLGVLEDLPSLLEREVVDEIVFVTPRNWLNDVRKCILYCEAVGVPATISTDLFDLEIASGTPKLLENKPYLMVETRRPKEVELLVKRVFDIFVSASVLILSLPVMTLVACAVKLTSPGPIFFRQVRCGMNRRRFVLYKFRSMAIGAEDKLKELAHKNEMTGPVFKMKDDPRLTKIGKFLRKTSLDEFPQFWNVLKGDMSVMGPRPPLPTEVEEYEPWQRRRLSMKPGITCIWQVANRNGTDFEEWMEMDLRYIDNWSLWLDLKILLMTASAVFYASGK